MKRDLVVADVAARHVLAGLAGLAEWPFSSYEDPHRRTHPIIPLGRRPHPSQEIRTMEAEAHALAPLITVLSHPLALTVWLLTAVPSVIVVWRDLRTRNRHIHGLMRWVWVLTTAYSSLLGLAVYWFSGRKEIARDSDVRRAFRSTAHCYSGCGMGEILGVILTVGILALGNLWVSLVTFTFAYILGFLLTFGPLVQGGETARQAAWDAFTSESASIVMMEVVAIGVDLWLAGSAGMGDVLFWMSLIVSLTVGFVAAYPVNYALILRGIKSGMMDPRDTGGHAHTH